VNLPTTVGMYTYLDSDAHVRVTVACDAIMQALATPGSGVSLAYIQTPSLAYIIGAEPHAASASAYANSWLSYMGYPPNAAPTASSRAGDPPRFVHDGILPLQGPNYVLAKSIQQWRAVLSRSRDGLCVSANVAPSSRTDSVLAGNKNGLAIKKVYAGMGHFPPMIAFDASTVSSCMSGLLLHDLLSPTALSSPATALSHPYDLFSAQAFHGGSFRVGVKPNALGTLWYMAGSVWEADPRPRPRL